MNDAIRLEGLTLTVDSVERAIDFYEGLLGLEVAWNAAPAFAMIRHGAATVGLLALDEAAKEGVQPMSAASRRGIHVEFTTDDLDALHEALLAKGVVFDTPPHDEPWERSMTALDPDGYSVEFAQGRRGKEPDLSRPGSMQVTIGHIVSGAGGQSSTPATGRAPPAGPGR